MKSYSINKLLTFDRLLAIIGLILSFIGLINSFSIKNINLYIYIILISILLVFINISIKNKDKAAKINKKIKNCQIVIEDVSIDALNISNLFKKQNKSLEVREATHKADISKKNMFLEFEYSGYCKSNNGEEGMIFTLDSDVNQDIDEIDCYGFDLKQDPDQKNKIRPILLKKSGLSKKVKLPFTKKINKGDSFHIKFFFKLIDCMKYGEDYFLSTLAFKNDIDSFKNEIKFDIKPEWVRCYKVSNGKTEFRKNLTSNNFIYKDLEENPSSNIAFIYIFERKEVKK